MYCLQKHKKLVEGIPVWYTNIHNGRQSYTCKDVIMWLTGKPSRRANQTNHQHHPSVHHFQHPPPQKRKEEENVRNDGKKIILKVSLIDRTARPIRPSHDR